MYITLIVIHVIACLILIATILLQAGRGGGLTETFGSDATQSVLGTQAPLILKRATTISAIVFMITCLLLGIMTARKTRSLFDRAQFPMMPVSQGERIPASALPSELAKEESLPVAGPISEAEESAPAVEPTVQAQENAPAREPVSETKESVPETAKK